MYRLSLLKGNNRGSLALQFYAGFFYCSQFPIFCVLVLQINADLIQTKIALGSCYKIYFMAIRCFVIVDIERLPSQVDKNHIFKDCPHIVKEFEITCKRQCMINTVNLLWIYRADSDIGRKNLHRENKVGI